MDRELTARSTLLVRLRDPRESAAEVATSLGMTASAVHIAKSRVLNRLRALIEQVEQP
jgi:hypothetical protein